MVPNDSDQIMADPDEIAERYGRETQEDVEGAVGSSSMESQLKVVVDQDHPFDLEGHISQYSSAFHLDHFSCLWMNLGRASIINLQHIIQHCPQLAGPALKLTAKIYRETTRDTGGYIQAIQAYNGLDIAQQDGTLLGDTTWIDEMELKNAKDKNKLEAELKTYTSNMIKESIRVGSLSCFVRLIEESGGRFNIGSWESFIMKLGIWLNLLNIMRNVASLVRPLNKLLRCR